MRGIRLGWKLGTVFLLAWLTIVPSLFFGSVLYQLKLILGFTGTVCIMAYVVGKGIETESPKFLAARKRLTGTLVFMAAGVAVASTGALEATLQSTSLLGIDLEIAGTIILVAGIGAMITVLAIAPRS